MLIKTAHAGVISDAPRLSELVLRVLQNVVEVLAVIAIISIVASGIIYITSSGDETKVTLAKQALTFSIIGLVVALISWVLINTFSTLAG